MKLSRVQLTTIADTRMKGFKQWSTQLLLLSWLKVSAVGHVQIRVMPNTPCLIGQAASAYVLGNNATGEDAEKVFALISSCGEPLSPL